MLIIDSGTRTHPLLITPLHPSPPPPPLPFPGSPRSLGRILPPILSDLSVLFFTTMRVYLYTEVSLIKKAQLRNKDLIGRTALLSTCFSIFIVYFKCAKDTRQFTLLNPHLYLSLNISAQRPSDVPSESFFSFDASL